MRIRIRFSEGPRVERRQGKNRHVAAGAGALLSPAAVMAAVLGVWRIGSDVGLAGAFAISDGFFSHWQVWLALAALLQLLAVVLNRYGSRRHN